MAFSVGIGLTNECNLKCPHCYRPDMVVERLTLRDVQRVCESIPTRSMNLGVGENGLHAEYEAILDYLWDRAIKTSITSNGLSIQALGDDAVDRKSTRLNSSHVRISYAVFCLQQNTEHAEPA